MVVKGKLPMLKQKIVVTLVHCLWLEAIATSKVSQKKSRNIITSASAILRPVGRSDLYLLATSSYYYRGLPPRGKR